MKKGEIKKFFIDNKLQLLIVFVLLIVWLACMIVGSAIRDIDKANTLFNSLELSGKGTEQSPYLIQDKADLLEFNENVEDYSSYEENLVHVTLTCDIDLGGMDWDPIGSKSSGPFFGGVFDGNGHTISNCNIVGEGYENVGFFSATWLKEGLEFAIKNLNLTGVTITSTENHECVGGLIGTSASNIINCNVQADIELYGIVGFTGGIVGSAKKEISNCTTSGSISGVCQEAGISGFQETQYPKIGGAIGMMKETGSAHDITNNVAINLSLAEVISDSDIVARNTIGGVIGQTLVETNYYNLINNADIHGVGSVGGIVGDYWSANATLLNCTNNGNIFSTSGMTLDVGGIVGSSYNNLGNSIKNCLNTGNIEAKAVKYYKNDYQAWGGGIMGVGSAKMENCKSTGDINIYGDTITYVGGIMGGCNGSIKNSYCTGDVTVQSSVGLIVGGVVGVLQDNLGIVLESCYYAGIVMGQYGQSHSDSVTIGGVVGFNMRSSGTTIKNNYYDTTVLHSTQNGLYTLPTLWYYSGETETDKYQGELISGNAGLSTEDFKVSSLNGFIAYDKNNPNSSGVWVFEQNNYPKLYWEK